MPQLLKGPYDILRWDKIFALLSMDGTEPFLPEMGLRPSHLEVVRTHARRFVQQFDVNTKTTQDQDEALVQSILADISQEAGPGIAYHLAQWGRDYFLYGVEESHTAEQWIKLLCHLAGVYPVPILASPPLPESKLAKIKQVTHEQLGDSYWNLREVLEEIDQQPKSGWDEAIYQAYRADNPELPRLSPLDWVRSSIQHHRFRQVWAIINSLLTTEELTDLLKWGKEQAHRLGIDSVWELELPE